MNILVFVKQVPDPNAIRFDASGHFSPNTPRVMNEYDQYGIEEAIQLKEERGDDVQVTIASIGPASARDAVNRGLAMGADRGILIQRDGDPAGSLATARALAELASEDSYDLIWVGQETSDSGTGNIGPQLSALLDIPFVSNVVGFQPADGGQVRFTREIEDGHAEVEVELPVIACALSGLSEPRSPSLKGIMAARRKPVEEREAPSELQGNGVVSWTALREEERTIEGTMIEEDDPKDAARRLVELLQERGLV